MTTIEELAKKYDENPKFEVSDVSEKFRYIEFSEYPTNYNILGAFAFEEGYIITSWNPDQPNPRLYFGEIEVGVEEVTQTRAVVSAPYANGAHGRQYTYVVEDEHD